MKRTLYKITRHFFRTSETDIDYNTAKTMIKNAKLGERVFLIDVRTIDEFYSKHLDGAINIPLQDFSDGIKKYRININDIVIVYCQYGGRSRKACNKLEKMGFTHVFNLKDGIEGI